MRSGNPVMIPDLAAVDDFWCIHIEHAIVVRLPIACECRVDRGDRLESRQPSVRLPPCGGSPCGNIARRNGRSVWSPDDDFIVLVDPAEAHGRAGSMASPHQRPAHPCAVPARNMAATSPKRRWFAVMAPQGRTRRHRRVRTFWIMKSRMSIPAGPSPRCEVAPCMGLRQLGQIT